MKTCIGIDMAKDKFDYCAMDSDLNVLCTGNNCSNSKEDFQVFADVLNALRSPGVVMQIGMESTGIYHLPLYNYLRARGYRIRLLNGLEVRGMKKSRVRKSSNDAIDAQSIAQYLMTTKEKDSEPFPEDLLDLKELVTAYSIITDKIRTTKNNVIRVMDMLFRGLSNIVDLDYDSIDMLSRYSTPEEFLQADQDELLHHVTKRRADRIRNAAESAPDPPGCTKALKIELGSLLRILRVLEKEKESIEEAMGREMCNRDHVIKSIPGIGDTIGSIILGKIGDIARFKSPEKLVAFVGLDPVIKESGKMRSERPISKRGDPLLRSAIYMSTVVATRSNPVISEFYRRKVEGGMPKTKALVAASRKQCHIIWSVWYNNRIFEIPEKFRTKEE